MGASPKPKVAPDSERKSRKKRITDWWERNKSRLERAAPAVTLVGSIATLIALGLSIWQSRDSSQIMNKLSNSLSKQTESLSNQADSLSQQTEYSKRIIDSLSTKYLGPFPESFNELPSFLSRDQDRIVSVDIAADYAYPGQYTVPAKALDYVQALETLSRRAKVRLLVFSNEKAGHELDDQFPQRRFDADKVKAKANPDKSAMHLFFQARGELVNCTKQQEDNFYDNLNVSAFKDILMHDETVAQSERLKSVERIEFSDDDLPIFMWLRSNRNGHKEAVFAIHHTPSPDLVFTHYFKTDDQNLVEAYQKLFDSLWKKNQRAKQTEVKELPMPPKWPPIACKK